MLRSRLVVLLALTCPGSISPLGCGASRHAESARSDRDRTSTRTTRRDPSSAPVAPPLDDAAPSLRVLSFNVNYGVASDPRNVAAVAHANADLVLLQETTPEAELSYREAFTATYPHVLFQDCCGAGGLGVMSKYPIVEHDYLPPTEGWFPAWRVVLDTPLGHVQALDVHLRPPMSDGGSWVAGFFSTRDVRLREMKDLFGHLDPHLPTIVAGDFNENAQGQAVGFLSEQGLVSALPQVAPRAKTWRWQTRAGTLRMMLDHVVYGPRLSLRHAEVIEQGVSDHFPLLVELGPSS